MGHTSRGRVAQHLSVKRITLAHDGRVHGDCGGQHAERVVGVKLAPVRGHGHAEEVDGQDLIVGKDLEALCTLTGADSA